MREVVAEFERPVMLYSIGKDSSVMLRLAQMAFYPGPIPFPLLHVDTTYKFREMVEFLKGEGLMVQKIPEQLEIVDQIQRNPAGKILKNDLRDRYID